MPDNVTHPADPARPVADGPAPQADVTRPAVPAAPDIAARGDVRPRLTPARVWGHLRTITHHKLLVARYCFRVGLWWQGLAHDLSKYGPAEFWTGARYYQGYRSPNAAERIDRGYSEAWLHHKGRNRHHFEYWIDIRGGGSIELVGMPMPTRYVVEMFCDRIAASRTYERERYTDASPLAYYEREHSLGSPVIHPDADALLRRLLELLAQQGEEVALRRVRDEIVRTRAVFGEHGRW